MSRRMRRGRWLKSTSCPLSHSCLHLPQYHPLHLSTQLNYRAIKLSSRINSTNSAPNLWLQPTGQMPLMTTAPAAWPTWVICVPDTAYRLPFLGTSYERWALHPVSPILQLLSTRYRIHPMMYTPAWRPSPFTTPCLTSTKRRS